MLKHYHAVYHPNYIETTNKNQFYPTPQHITNTKYSGGQISLISDL